ncbi:HNH endonuclease [Variovorax sp. J22P271]|uniref:HNH endonuclease n=1 Tax=Variovorax davisae TaxID=3053515 RepID=UPI0025773FF9|nr:HNH endonuclease [Variovorax sp. J22P271]MDM0032857.1 HNH endonuclease [Variovorax sp. J22P271]
MESNIAQRDGLSDEIARAIRARSTDLGLALVTEKTGIEVDRLTPAERQIVQAISEYVGIMRRKGKYPGRTLEQVRNRGLIDAAEEAVCRAKPTQGFQVLAEADLEDLSYEQIVLDHQGEFSSRAIWFSRRTLGLGNPTEKPPAATHSDTQTRTSTLIMWLRDRAIENDGHIPAFTNADAARVMSMDDMQRYGQVHGNIQSRIDFACYLCKLPPLGCAADAPFSKAWAQQGRDWAFPVPQMQAAAQERQWSSADFDQLLRATEGLPGQAHISWKDAIASAEERVKAWALKFADARVPPDDADDAEEVARKRNPIWTRDELILALGLYLKHGGRIPGADTAEVAELSSFLNKMGRVLGLAEADTYRNTNGVYMKMMNFRRFDPEYIKDGKKGLTRGNKDEEIVWGEFSQDHDRLNLVCAAIRRAVDEHAEDQDLGGTDDPGICDAPEGRVLTHMHRVRERSRKLVDQAKKQALKKYGRLSCEACSFDFETKYGPTGSGLIDVHHTKPVHTLVEGGRTRIEDLALLCANCHRVVHSSRKWLSVAEVAELVRPKS